MPFVFQYELTKHLPFLKLSEFLYRTRRECIGKMGDSSEGVGVHIHLSRRPWKRGLRNKRLSPLYILDFGPSQVII
jgi:hypothetical protein